MIRVAVVFIGIAVLLAGATVAFDAQLADSGTDVQVENESFTPTSGTVITLNESARDDVIYNESVTVRDENDTVMTAGSDYRWFANNGTVKPVAGGDLAGDANATVTYGYLDTTEGAIRGSNVVAQIPSLFGMALPLGAVLLFILALRG